VRQNRESDPPTEQIIKKTVRLGRRIGSLSHGGVGMIVTRFASQQSDHAAKGRFLILVVAAAHSYRQQRLGIFVWELPWNAWTPETERPDSKVVLNGSRGLVLRWSRLIAAAPPASVKRPHPADVRANGLSPANAHEAGRWSPPETRKSLKARSRVWRHWSHLLGPAFNVTTALADLCRGARMAPRNSPLSRYPNTAHGNVVGRSFWPPRARPAMGPRSRRAR